MLRNASIWLRRSSRCALRERQSLADPPRAEMVEDCHALTDPLARGGHQGRRLAGRIDLAVGVALHDFRHLDAAEPIRAPSHCRATIEPNEHPDGTPYMRV